jgi:hypothetical protein
MKVKGRPLSRTAWRSQKSNARRRDNAGSPLLRRCLANKATLVAPLRVRERTGALEEFRRGRDGSQGQNTVVYTETSARRLATMRVR